VAGVHPLATAARIASIDQKSNAVLSRCGGSGRHVVRQDDGPRPSPTLPGFSNCLTGRARHKTPDDGGLLFSQRRRGWHKWPN